MMDNISKLLIHNPSFHLSSYINKSLESEGKFPLKVEGLTAYHYGSTLSLSLSNNYKISNKKVKTNNNKGLNIRIF